MKHKTNKKILIIFSLILFSFFILSSFALAQKPLEVDYPEVFGEKLPEKPLLPEYIKYIFNLALLVGGLIAFGALVSGGFRYMSSVGSPSAMDDAKNQITAGFLGLIILLSSFLILTTVNPQLTILKMKPVPVKQGIVLCSSDCTTDAQLAALSDNEKEYVGTSREIRDFNAAYIHFLSPMNILEVTLWENATSSGAKTIPVANGIISQPAPPNPPKSITLHWKMPGVYLVKGDEEVQLIGDTSNLSALNFNDKATHIKFKLTKDDVDKNVIYGVVLHEHEDYQGEGKIFLSDWKPDITGGVVTTFPDGSKEVFQVIQECNQYGCLSGTSAIVSSAHIFKIADSVGTGYVNLCEKAGCAPPPDGGEVRRITQASSPPIPVSPPQAVPGNLSDNLRAIQIINPGEFIVVLFEDWDGSPKQPSGKCEVFTYGISDLTKSNPIGNCGIDFCIPFTEFCFWKPCASSFAIYPIK